MTIIVMMLLPQQIKEHRLAYYIPSPSSSQAVGSFDIPLVCRRPDDWRGDDFGEKRILNLTCIGGELNVLLLRNCQYCPKMEFLDAALPFGTMQLMDFVAGLEAAGPRAVALFVPAVEVVTAVVEQTVMTAHRARDDLPPFDEEPDEAIVVREEEKPAGRASVRLRAARAVHENAKTKLHEGLDLHKHFVCARENFSDSSSLFFAVDASRVGNKKVTLGVVGVPGKVATFAPPQAPPLNSIVMG